MQPRHSSEELDALRQLTVPTLANAIETFGLRPANSGYSNSTLQCHYPGLGLMLGYAVTARAITNRPPSKAPSSVPEPDYWRYIAAQPGPKIAVVQDIDSPPGGAMWGEWNANVHQALGCVGTVTEGAVRDLDGVEKLGFHFFSTSVLPAHGYGAFIDYGGLVQVAGLAIRAGDLLAGDRHGVLLIPPEVPLPELVKVAEEIDRLESEIFACCQSSDFTIEALIKVSEAVMNRWPRPDGQGKHIWRTV